jgi:hypothetical protein
VGNINIISANSVNASHSEGFRQVSFKVGKNQRAISAVFGTNVVERALSTWQ